MLERATPFPAILAAGCEAPCRAACRLSEVPGGQAVDIPAIERAAMRHGVARTGKGLLKFKKKKTAAVFGAEPVSYTHLPMLSMGLKSPIREDMPAATTTAPVSMPRAPLSSGRLCDRPLMLCIITHKKRLVN